MKRRQFVKHASIAGLALPLTTVFTPAEAWSILIDQHPLPPDFSIEETTIDVLSRKMVTGELTARAVAKLYLDRIAGIDRQGPVLNSVIEINPDALAIAETLDRERKSGKVRGPFHGIPLLIKDNIETADRMMTTAGSIALNGFYAREDAFIVSRLRDAGAVILGKANLSEWANFRSTRSTSGWSSRGGQTRNPYALDRNPCGSSSGSAVAVSANLCAIAIGTETNGSIACPSSTNGIVGIKPTVGLCSRTGIIPISHTQDTAGPMARTVSDAALALGIIAGIDPDDESTLRSAGKSVTDYTVFLDPRGLQGKRLGVEKAFLKVHPSVDELLQRAIGQIRTAGAEVVEVDFRSRLKLEGAPFRLLQFEFKHGLNKYFASRNTQIRTLKDLIEFNKANEAKAMPYFKQEILEGSEARGGLDSQEYQDALAKILSVRDAIDQTLAEFRLDAIFGPANGPPWCTDLVNGDSFTGYGMYSSAAMAGYPHITVPLGFVFGLPVGLNFFASAFQEGPLIAIAFAYEQISKNRAKPLFLAKAKM